VPREVPSVVGTVTKTSPALPFKRLRMLSARSRPLRSTSAVDGILSEEGDDGEHGPWRWFSGSQAPVEDGMLTAKLTQND
jgi:hypothetical protein